MFGKMGVAFFCGLLITLVNRRMEFVSQCIKTDVLRKNDVLFWANDISWCAVVSMVLGLVVIAMMVWMWQEMRDKSIEKKE